MKARCIVCDNSAWENVDEMRLKPLNMCICKKCGFVSYPDAITDKSILKEYYENEYRRVATVNNVHTGQRKLHFHSAFLRPVLEKWKAEKKTPVVTDVGAAFGMFLNWFRQIFPEGDYSGTEWDAKNRRIAYHEYKLNLNTEIDMSKKYDLIASYKVAEHQIDADKELMKYRECISDNGYLYMSVPTWFNVLNNFGVSGFDLEYYYAKPHINVWTSKLFQKILKKTGWEIILYNNTYYDETFLCKKTKPQSLSKSDYEDAEEIKERMRKIKQAYNLFSKSKFEEALRVWPNFPYCRLGYYEINRQPFNKKGFKWIAEKLIPRFLEACPTDAMMRLLAGDICMRYDEFEMALKFFEKSLEMKPNNDKALLNISNCFRQLANKETDQKQRVRLFTEARNVARYLRDRSLQNANEATNWIFYDDSQIPIGE